MEVTVEEFKKWKYYEKAAKNFPKIPKRINEILKKAGFFKKPVPIRGELNKISLRSFKRRVSHYETDHLPTQNISLYIKNFKSNS